jgi:hypothetical protein
LAGAMNSTALAGYFWAEEIPASKNTPRKTADNTKKLFFIFYLLWLMKIENSKISDRHAGRSRGPDMVTKKVGNF